MKKFINMEEQKKNNKDTNVPVAAHIPQVSEEINGIFDE
jgi:hypothetical protein